MEQDNFRNNGRIYTGIFFIAAGVLLCAYKMGAPLPGWLFTWPVILIAVGLLLCVRHNFTNPSGLILILIGGVHLIDRLNPGFNLHSFIFPAIIIGIGIILIFRPKRGTCTHRGKWTRNETGDYNTAFQLDDGATRNDSSDYIDSISVFGGVKKTILSKNFRGGEITCFMGGAEFNLSQADLHGTVLLEITQVFGGTKIIVPASWYIKTEMITVFGGIEDKRPVLAGNTNPEKVLILKGTTVFGGIDIRSY